MVTPSYVQLVTQALAGAGRPLTLAEIKARVEMVRPVRTGNPEATLRGAMPQIPQVASLGGRPAHCRPVAQPWWGDAGVGRWPSAPDAHRTPGQRPDGVGAAGHAGPGRLVPPARGNPG
jgi:hypothetical protein